MWHFLMLAIAYTCVLASPAEAAPKKKGPPPDLFKACDLQLRSDLREGGTWLIPRDIRLDEGRLMLTGWNNARRYRDYQSDRRRADPTYIWGGHRYD